MGRATQLCRGQSACCGDGHVAARVFLASGTGRVRNYDLTSHGTSSREPDSRGAPAVRSCGCRVKPGGPFTGTDSESMSNKEGKHRLSRGKRPSPCVK